MKIPHLLILSTFHFGSFFFCENQCHLHQMSSFTTTTILSAGTSCKFMQSVTFRSHCGCLHRLSSKKVYTGTVKNDPYKCSHLKQPCNSCGFKIYQKHLFLCDKKEKLGVTVSIIYFSKMTMRRQCQQTNLLQILMHMMVLLMYMIIIPKKLGFKFLLCLNGKFCEKTTQMLCIFNCHRYILVRLWVTVFLA